MNKCISFDWVQVHVYLHSINLFQVVDNTKYVVMLRANGTQQFKRVWDIVLKKTNETIAVLASEPHHENFMKPNAGILKVINKYLYTSELKAMLQTILSDFQMVFQNFTRIDVCMDFLEFENGYQVQQFLHDYVADRIVKKRKATVENLFRTTPRIDKDGHLHSDWETCTWGRASSDVRYRLYNKSLEQAKEKFKPHIFEHWHSHGYDGKQTVWRLEFELHNDTRGMVLETGEVLFFRDINLLDRASDIFQHAFKLYFEFIWSEQTKYGTHKKKSRCREVVLFTDFKADTCIIRPDCRKDHTRKHKTFIRNLELLNHELRHMETPNNEGDYLAMIGNALLTIVVKQRNLEQWAQDRLPGYQPSQWALDHWNEMNQQVSFPLEFGKKIEHVPALEGVFAS
jgi:hypothetical protein